MSKTSKPDLPIGYWLKEVDNLLNKFSNRVQKKNGVTRFEWQVLNMLAQMGSTNRDGIFIIMRTFIEEVDLDNILTKFISQGWVEELVDEKSGKTNFRLSEEGKALHKVLLETQKEARKKIMLGIVETEYATTLRVLQQIVSNLKDSD